MSDNTQATAGSAKLPKPLSKESLPSSKLDTEVLYDMVERLKLNVSVEVLKDVFDLASPVMAKYEGVDHYAVTAERLGVTREEAKARVLGAAYGLIKPSAFEQVSQFHKRFELPSLDQEKPRYLTDEEALFRINFMLEELAEYALNSGFQDLSLEVVGICGRVRDKDSSTCSRVGEANWDLHEQLDALVDLSYVVHGTALFHGFKRFDEAFETVHRANMAKVRAERVDQSKRGSTFDVVKPKGWTAPVLTEFLS